jgi:uncharacterized membrane protein
MNRRRIGIPEKWLHRAFVATLAFKAIFAVAETVAGIGAFFVDQGTIVALARRVTREELFEDPRDLLANYLLHAAQHLSIGSAHFIGVYLTSHGLVKLGLVAALLMRKLWAYPLAIAVFAIFIAYQVYRYTLTAAPSLIFLTAVDLVVIVLTWHEYRYLRRMPGGRRRARA